MDNFPRIFPDVPKANAVYFPVSIPKRSVVGVILGFAFTGFFKRVSPGHGNVVWSYHRIQDWLCSLLVIVDVFGEEFAGYFNSN